MVTTRVHQLPELPPEQTNQSVVRPGAANKRRKASRAKNNKKITLLLGIKRSTYVIIFVVCTTLLVIQTHTCVERYLSEPTYISSYISDQRNAQFPEITVCYKANGYKKEVLGQHGIQEIDHYSGRTNHTWQSINKSVTPQELFQLATYSLEELIGKWHVRSLVANEEGQYSFKIMPGQNDSIYTFREQRHRGFGRCYTARPGPLLKSIGVYYLKLTFLKDVKLYVHHQDQFLDLSGRMGVKVLLGTRNEMQINWLEIQMLERTIETAFQCRREPPYDQCIYQEVTKISKELSGGCTVPWLIDDTNICENEQDKNISYWAHYNRITNQMGSCPNPCNFLTVNIGAKNRVPLHSNATSLVYFYFQSRTLTSIENFLYLFVNLAAEFGGYVGLFLGVAIFQAADLLGTLIDTKVEKLRKEQEKNGDGKDGPYRLDDTNKPFEAMALDSNN